MIIHIRNSDTQALAPNQKVNTRMITTNRPSPRLQRMLKAAALATAFRAENPGHEGGLCHLLAAEDRPWLDD